MAAYLILGVRLDQHGLLYVHDADIYSEDTETITHALNKVVPVTAMCADHERDFAGNDRAMREALEHLAKTSKPWKAILDMLPDGGDLLHASDV